MAFITAGLSSTLLVKVKAPDGTIKSLPKVLAGALSPLLTMMGIAGAVLGLFFTDLTTFVAGSLSAALTFRYFQQVTRSYDNEFSATFGPHWKEQIPDEIASRMLSRRWQWYIAKPSVPRWERDIVYWKVADMSHREVPLLCDLWLPPPGIKPSSLAFIYNHGGGWCYLDKDLGTRPFFRHLVAQGHVVMDVAYRLCPPRGLPAMVGDVKRAIVWLRSQAGRLGIDPERIVVAGGSAGAHLALLSAYSAGDPVLTPDELRGADTSVRAVVSYYGVADMYATQAAVNSPEIARLLGGWPSEVPDVYTLASPIHHIKRGSPATMLIQGTDDWYMPVESTRAMHQKLRDVGTPVVYVELPQTDHAFDFMLPSYSPSAQAALYHLERFLALMA